MLIKLFRANYLINVTIRYFFGLEYCEENNWDTKSAKNWESLHGTGWYYFGTGWLTSTDNHYTAVQ